jgi:hypothetical protein
MHLILISNANETHYLALVRPREGDPYDSNSGVRLICTKPTSG